MQSILRFDTTNPPGNETAAARYLQSKLAEADIDDCTVLESAPGRGNVLARLPASAPGGASRRPLLLLCHLDVVPADAASWRHGPFAGEVADGQVWGRGALDMKNFVAVWTALVLWARRLRLPSDRDIVLAATADEEVGGALGARWLAENHPDWVDAEIAFNEGVLGPFTLNGVTYCPVQVAEKAGAPIELVARGTPGHASIPLPDNPLVQLGRALIAIGEAPLPLHRTGPTSAFLRGLAESQPPEVGRALLALLEAGADTAALARALPEGHLRNLVGALLANTASPTIAEAGVKSNVIPERAVAHLDCRILPGQTGESVLAEVAARLREAGLGEAVQARLLGVGVGPTESPVDPALFDALQAALDRRPSGGRAVPFCSAAATDSRFLRQRGTAAYGLFPGLPDMPEETIHGIDERISLASLQRCLEVMWDVVAALCIPA